MTMIKTDENRAKAFGTLIARELTRQTGTEYVASAYLSADGEAPDNRPQVLVTAEGFGIRLSFPIRWKDEEQERIEVAGIWPIDHDLKTHRPYEAAASITVSSQRTPAAIAKDIVKRFLPTYADQWRKQDASRLRANQYKADTEETRKRLLAEGGKLFGDGRVSFDDKLPFTWALSPQGKSVRFEAFNASIDQTLAMIDALREDV